MKPQISFTVGWSFALAVTNLAAQALDPWQTVEDDSTYGIAARALAKDRAGNTYVAGVARADAVNHGLIRKSSDAGATWTTVDDFVYPDSYSSPYYDLAADPAGNLYVVGAGFSYTPGADAWVVRKSADGGLNWATVDDVHPFEAKGTPSAVTTDASGEVYVAGFAAGTFMLPDGQTQSGRHWMVRKSSDVGANWTTVDEFAPNGWAEPKAIVSTAKALFVAGVTTPTQPNLYHWVVRRSTDGGATWTVVDDYQYDPAHATQPASLAADSSGNIFAAGGASVPTVGSPAFWLIRKSTDGGNTWATVDAFRYTQQDSFAARIGVSPQGAVFAAGRAGTGGRGHWLVRSSTDAGMTWTVSDDFHFPGANSAVLPYGFVSDDAGNLYVGGQAVDSEGQSHWIVRKLSAVPLLRIERSGPQVAISWPASPAGFSLEAADFLSPAPNWSAVGDAPVVIGDQNVVTLDAANAARLFRLKKP